MIITDLRNDLTDSKLFKNKLRSEGRTYTWLAHTTGYSVGHVINVLSGRDTLTEKMKNKFIKVLNYDPSE